jgi:hypothetical protein
VKSLRLALAYVALGCAGSEPRPVRDASAGADAPSVGLHCARDTTSVFPDSALREREGWYGKHLRALGEGRLCPVPPGVAEAYRFLWLRTFHHPVVVTVERGQHGTRLRARETDGAGGYEPGRLIVDTAAALSDAQWQEVAALVAGARLWDATELPGDDVSGLDGAQWIVEGVRDGRYRAVDVWTPTADGPGAPVRRLGVRLLSLAGRLPRDTIRVY